MDPVAARAVRFGRYGDRDVLYVAGIPMPVPGKGEVLVEIRATGINPAETKIRTGASVLMWRRCPGRLPCGPL